MDLVDKLKEYSVLTEEEYKELLLTEDPLLRAKLFRGLPMIPKLKPNKAGTKISTANS